MAFTDTVIAAFIGSFVTIVALLINNWNERKLKQKERIDSAKQEIYIESIVEVTKIKQLINKIAYIPATEVKDINLDLFEISKTNLVSENETSAAISKYIATLASIFFDLLSEATKAHIISLDIEFLNSDIDNDLLTNKKNLHDLEALNRNTQEYVELEQTYIEVAEKLNSNLSLRDNKYSELNSLQIQLSIKAIELLESSIDEETECLKCIREELGLKFDAQSYKTRMNLLSKNAKEKLSIFHKEIHSNYSSS